MVASRTERWGKNIIKGPDYLGEKFLLFGVCLYTEQSFCNKSYKITITKIITAIIRGKN